MVVGKNKILVTSDRLAFESRRKIQSIYQHFICSYIPSRVSNVLHHALDYQVDMFLKNFVIYLSKNIFLVRDVAVFVDNTTFLDKI